jgi:hypothetical protein
MGRDIPRIAAAWNTRPEEDRLRARIAELEEHNKMLRHIMTHIDGSIVMKAKESAGYGVHIHTLQIPATP